MRIDCARLRLQIAMIAAISAANVAMLIGLDAHVPLVIYNASGSAPLGFYYPGDPGYPGKRGREMNWGVFAPRFGFAWDAKGDGKTSVRGSVGIAYDYLNIQAHLWTSISPPFKLSVRPVST